MPRSLVNLVPAGARWAAYALAATAAVGLTAFTVSTLSGVGGARADALFNDGLYNVLQLLAVAGCCLRLAFVRTDRVPWALITLGVASWTAADLLFTFAYDNEPPYPSAADILYLAFYPLVYVGLLLLVRLHVADFNRSLWLDGLTAALAAAALGAAVLVEIVLAQTDGAPSVVMTNLAYPLGDVLLLSVVIGVFALAGWRPGRAWLFIGLGMVCQVVADAAFLIQAAAESYVPGAPFDCLWPLGMLLLAWAAWQAPASGAERRQARSWLATPAVAALFAIAVLLYDHFHKLNPLALTLAVATLVVILLRLRLTFRENEHILEQIRTQSVTDALTGLGNRRRLVDDLARALLAGDAAEARTLMIFDLDGFKRYNDTFGHPAGDALLERLGGRLSAVVEGHGTAYRLGGDEFCVLTSAAADEPLRCLEKAVEALSDRGEGFTVTTSYGAISLPADATDPSEALRQADQRLYTQKHSSELARNRPHEVLLQALSEREPDLLEHSRAVASLSMQVGARLALSDGERTTLRIAAELHDVGKLAIPDEILTRPGPLTEAEWHFLRRHTEIGQRIAAATPALQDVGRIIRASHERWDGEGYPDGLSGPGIPLAARIITVCDAFTAMTTGRPYGKKMTADAALGELERCAGTQFDPGVVSALIRAFAAGDLPLAATG